MGRTQIVTSQIVWKPILGQYSVYTCAMWKLEASGVHTVKYRRKHLVSGRETWEMKNNYIYCYF